MKACSESVINFFQDAVDEVSEMMPDSGISEEQMKQIIKRYVAVFEGNFIAWMGTAVATAVSPEARFASTENLHVEVKENHAGMLREFAESIDCIPGQSHLNFVREPMSLIRKELAKLSGLKSTALMGILESSSTVFIPIIDDYSKKLGLEDNAYCNIHGEIDMEHAEQFIWATEHELKYSEQNIESLAEVKSIALNLIRKIFTV